ncbi:nucleotidyltransferase domain-containing protein [Oscillatoria sp. CS-180]|uniref:nucleotidyltransferase family protein n=1 Tax=Oscillatoria sp. CS-180 TaxID=3021720 RepID=UPI00232C8722|nr:nucleotidyltransferase domain-containing protein [Oscillatoria sp. CS-180]MDB9529185.1 nucleotidyltransferase domain-containing protein [Oscillatoria sp. CS-180]
MQPYIETARRRQQQQREKLRQRRLHGLRVAQEAATLLREAFGVSHVVVFGSVLDETAFHGQSDLDLAVWNLDPEHYFAAVAQLLALSEFSIDLVPVELASPPIRAAIAQGTLL